MKKCKKEKWEKVEQEVLEKLSKNEISKDCSTWHQSKCPHCESYNWILMSLPFKACECFNCKKTFWISHAIHEEFKTSLIMSRVFQVTVRLSENIFLGMKKPF